MRSSLRAGSRSARTRAAHLGWLVVVVLGAACALMPGAGPTAAPCDDSLRLNEVIPLELRRAGVHAAMGAGDTWLLPPVRGTWSDLVRRDERGYALKIAIWSLSDSPPSVVVRQLGGERLLGQAELKPTSGGLPGPIPSTVYFAVPGCWEIEARGKAGVSVARVHIVGPSLP